MKKVSTVQKSGQYSLFLLVEYGCIQREKDDDRKVGVEYMTKDNELLENCLFEGVGKNEDGTECHFRVVSRVVDGNLVIVMEEYDN